MPDPLWVSLPANLDALLARLLDLKEYPVIGPSRATCGIALLAELAPDPHDWRLWRTGTFPAFHENRLVAWPLYLRRCATCGAVEVRKEGQGGYIASNRRAVRNLVRTPGPADVLLGWYQPL